MQGNSELKHDGLMVRKLIDGIDMKHGTFGASMQWDAAKTSRMLSHPSWNTDDLLKASRVIGINLFSTYHQYLPQQHVVMVPIAILEGSSLLKNLRYLAEEQWTQPPLQNNKPPAADADG